MTDQTSPTTLTTTFAGTRGPLFRKALWGSIWTILTLGFYRFWLKTRLRRWYWSAIRPGGTPLEYVGDPLEKLLGFFLAVVVLAFYIGVVNLILMFVSLSLLASNVTAYIVSFVGVIPIWFYARYRARRYTLARSRWRGVRFGLKPGAWGYAARALWHWALTILSLGVLWPRKTFYLEKYKTDRTVFGSATLHQGGRWQMLMPAYAHILISAVILAATTYQVVMGQVQVAYLYALGVPWFVYGLIHYSVEATRLLANHKTAGDIALRADPRPATLTRIYVFGYLATGLISLLPVAPILMVVGMVENQRWRATYDITLEPGLIYGLPLYVWTGLGVAAYFLVFLLWATLRHCFVTMPVWRHYAETLTIENAPALANVSQKQRDEFAEAEGFAEALDLWGAI
ncbi:DUF898 domain-containing protein [Pseudooctadecabacter jejudonensis]|uniref:Inner membrane protein YjgN n=1 Tax=Pseudooctadecabacter jejudonensis TaxID=1391910 RepID=A0A1Y5RZL5_9RHOB|nr:DUF898 domain-containing protein [Pseudooctadecabacter jejudonensis]SLN28966.1 hypothetical protein PSJ8397_01239 [Pseudooctadecabacter jejudonensis]